MLCLGYGERLAIVPHSACVPSDGMRYSGAALLEPMVDAVPEPVVEAQVNLIPHSLSHYDDR